jgi:hypothetical protein
MHSMKNLECYYEVTFYVSLTVHHDIFVQRKANLMHNLFLVYFVKLYMFRGVAKSIIRRYNHMYTTIGTYYYF